MMVAQLLFIGTRELILIAGIALLLFGGKKLPEMMRGMGQGVKEFKKGMHEIEKPIEEVKEVIKEATVMTPSDTVTVSDASEKDK